jgi:hypothetical protein
MPRSSPDRSRPCPDVSNRSDRARSLPGPWRRHR